MPIKCFSFSEVHLCPSSSAKSYDWLLLENIGHKLDCSCNSVYNYNKTNKKKNHSKRTNSFYYDCL